MERNVLHPDVRSKSRMIGRRWRCLVLTSPREE
jgi:hypothetical protein